MSEETVSEHLRSMRAALQMINLQLGRSGIAFEGISDLKSEIDNLRLRIWAIMAADRDGQSPASLERFRIRRAMEITGAIAKELEQGAMSARHPELVALDAQTQRLHRAFEKTRDSGNLP